MWSTTSACCWISRRCARTARWMGTARNGKAEPADPVAREAAPDPVPSSAHAEEPASNRPMRPIISFWPAIREEG